MIILIGGEKGGTGKTTLVTNLAADLARKGEDILLVDTDRQGSASDWAATREQRAEVFPITCVQVFGNAVAAQIKDLSKRYSSIVIDAGGRDSFELRGAMGVADVILIPVQTSQFDVWTIDKMERLVAEVRVVANPKLEAKIIFNRVSTHPLVSEITDAKEVVKDCKELKLCESIIRNRIIFSSAAKVGLGISEMKIQDHKANEEMINFYNEVFTEKKDA